MKRFLSSSLMRSRSPFISYRALYSVGRPLSSVRCYVVTPEEMASLSPEQLEQHLRSLSYTELSELARKLPESSASEASEETLRDMRPITVLEDMGLDDELRAMLSVDPNAPEVGLQDAIDVNKSDWTLEEVKTTMKGINSRGTLLAFLNYLCENNYVDPKLALEWTQKIATVAGEADILNSETKNIRQGFKAHVSKTIANRDIPESVRNTLESIAGDFEATGETNLQSYFAKKLGVDPSKASSVSEKDWDWFESRFGPQAKDLRASTGKWTQNIELTLKGLDMEKANDLYTPLKEEMKNRVRFFFSILRLLIYL